MTTRVLYYVKESVCNMSGGIIILIRKAVALYYVENTYVGWN